ncbi:MAG: hypothetical protein PVG11_02900 [Anaerolineae bacterium]|jgi:hypothetical protein
MGRREEKDLLMAYTDHLLGITSAPPRRGMGRHERVQALLALADHLHAILVPVQPDPHFRRRLHGELILEAQRIEAGEAPRFGPQRRLSLSPSRGIVIGAVLGSIASVVGVVIAVLLRRRAGHMAAG